jgi:hypothetical protein
VQGGPCRSISVSASAGGSMPALHKPTEGGKALLAPLADAAAAASSDNGSDTCCRDQQQT